MERLAVGVETAAEMLSVCSKTIRNLIACKQLPSKKIGRRRVIRVCDLEAFLRRDHATGNSVADVQA
jgi:excisionase family DNA binding protein